MNKDVTLAKLIELGRERVREYDRVRALYPSAMTDMPLDCVREAARICQLGYVANALGLMDYEEYSTAIHEPEHGPKGIKIVAIDLGLRKMGEVHPEPEPKENEEGYK